MTKVHCVICKHTYKSLYLYIHISHKIASLCSQLYWKNYTLIMKWYPTILKNVWVYCKSYLFFQIWSLELLIIKESYPTLFSTKWTQGRIIFHNFYLHAEQYTIMNNNIYIYIHTTVQKFLNQLNKRDSFNWITEHCFCY